MKGTSTKIFHAVVHAVPQYGTSSTLLRYETTLWYELPKSGTGEYQQPVPAVPPLELEVNERLYLRTLHLNNQIDYGNQQQCLPYQWKANDRCCKHAPAVRHEMQEEAERHQGKHFPIAHYQLREKPGTESREYLPQHIQRS